MSQNLQYQFGDSYVGYTSEPSEAEKSSDDDQRKVPALQKVVMVVMARQKLLRFIEPIGQLSDKKRYELALEKFSTILKWNSGNEIHPSEIHPSQSGNLKLQFLGSICPLVFTGIPIVGEENSLQVALLDAITGEVITSGPEASAKVEIIVIDRGFGVDEGEGWTVEEFNSKIVSGREGKKSLLGGKRYLHLKDGIGSVHEIYFKHTNVWRRNGEYRLWARVVDHSNGRRIIVAKTEPFTVKDRRGMNKKHYPPSLSDEVWRLKNIRKGGPFDKRLSEENIKTVEDFLTQYSSNREKLQEILGKSMSGKRWEATVNHAQTFKHYTSLAHHSLPSSDSLYPKNFDNPDCSNVYYFGTSDMHDRYNPTQPGTSFQGIISPILPSSPTSTLEEHGLQNNSNMDHIYDQSSSVPGNDTNSLLCDLGPLFSNWDINNSMDFLKFDLEPVLENHGLESVANQQSAVHAVAVTSSKPRRRWAIISKGLGWLFKMRKLVSSKKNNVAKKRRLH